MVLVDAALPATSVSVVAGTNWWAPEDADVESAVQVPAHAPVTLKVRVLLALLSTSVPVKVTVRVVLELVRYPLPPVLRSPLVSPLIPYDVVLLDRESVSAAVAGTVAGLSASLNVTANVSVFTLIAPFLFAVTMPAAEVVGALVSYVNVVTMFADALPAVSRDHEVTV